MLWDEVARSKSEPDDLKRVRGIDADIERRLREFGVARYQDIAGWSPTDVGRFATVLGVGSRIDTERWIDQAKILARGEETEYARSIRLGKVAASGVAAASAAAVASAAIGGTGIGGSAGDGGKVELATAKALAEAELVGSRINKIPEGDDLTLIRGIGPSLKARLYERGITRFGQLAALSSDEVAKLGSDLGLPGVIEREAWVGQAKSLMPAAAMAAAMEAPAATVAVPGAAAAVPAVAVAAVVPAVVAAVVAPAVAVAAVPTAAGTSGDNDDLKHIRGIGPEIEKRLNELGVRSFADVARWSPADIDRLNNVFGFKGRIERENWVEQAQILARGGETDFSRRFAASAASTAGQPGVAIAGGPVAVASAVGGATVAAVAGGAVSAAAPLVEAVSAAAAVAPAAAAAAIPVAVAAGSAVVAEVAKPIAANVPVAGAAKPAAAAAATSDDLKRIRGIGVVIEKKLQAMGVSNYQHIAAWTPADVEKVSEQLDFKGRIERENWIAQARILAGGGQTDFSRRVDRGEVDSSQDR